MEVDVVTRKYEDFIKEISKQAFKHKRKSSLLNCYIEYDLNTMMDDVDAAFRKYKDNKRYELTSDVKNLWNKKFTKIVVRLAKTLTIDEAEYLTCSYLDNTSNKVLGDLLNDNYYEEVKESCLVKTWYALKALD